MKSELQSQVVATQSVSAKELPTLSTVNNLPHNFPDAGLTPASIRADIFKAEDRHDSKGRLIPGNGLAATGAIIRRGRKILIDVEKYGAWLAGKGNVKSWL